MTAATGVAHACGDALTFGTDANGRAVERCDRCRYEAQIQRRPPSAAERSPELARNGKPRKAIRDRALLPGETRPCLGGCGVELSARFARYCDDCRARKARTCGKASHEPIGIPNGDEALCSRCEASYALPSDTLCRACRFEIDVVYGELPA